MNKQDITIAINEELMKTDSYLNAEQLTEVIIDGLINELVESVYTEIENGIFTVGIKRFDNVKNYVSFVFDQEEYDKSVSSGDKNEY